MAQADNSDALFWRHWRRETDPSIGTLLCVPGLQEHSGRYESLAAAACKAGLDVLAVDLYGHGRSPGRRGHMRDFTGDHLRAVDEMMSGADEAGLDAPRYLLGHSLGGLIVARWAQLHLGEGQVAGLILMTPFIAPQIHVAGWKRFVAFALSGLMPGFTLPTEIRDKDLFRDPVDEAAFASDPLVQRRISAGHWVAMGREQQRLIDSAEELRVPVLLQIAVEDRIADSNATRTLGHLLPDVTIVEYEEAFHPLHADPVSRQVFEDLIGWVRRQAP